MNKIIKVLITNNVILNLGWGLMTPIFAIFIVQKISGGDIIASIKVAGFSELVFYIAKSIFQIPIGKYLDSNHGEKDDFWFMVVGSLITAFIPVGFIFSTQPWHIYIIRIIHAVGAAMIFPSWSALFTRHIDSGKEAAEWSIQSTFACLVVGIAGGAGGVMAASLGFASVFIFVSLFTVISAGTLLLIKDKVSPVNKDVIRIPIRVMP